MSRYCSKCDKYYKEIKSLRKYDKKCLDCGTTLVYECKKCNKQYQVMASLRHHTQTLCDAQNLIQCAECGYQSAHRYRMRNHMLIHEFVHPMNYLECDKCKAKFKHMKYLTTHLRSCENSKKIVKTLLCKHCPFKTHHHVALKSHLAYAHSKTVYSDDKNLEPEFKINWTIDSNDGTSIPVSGKLVQDLICCSHFIARVF